MNRLVLKEGTGTPILFAWASIFFDRRFHLFPRLFDSRLKAYFLSLRLVCFTLELQSLARTAGGDVVSELGFLPPVVWTS